MGNPKKLTFSGVMFYVVNIVYMINVFGILLSVLVNSFGVKWPNGAWLPDEFGLKWWEYCGAHHELGQLLFMTMLVTVITVLLSVVLAYPAAFIMAKRQFAGKKLINSASGYYSAYLLRSALSYRALQGKPGNYFGRSGNCQYDSYCLLHDSGYSALY